MSTSRKDTEKTLGQQLIEGMKEALAHSRGEIDLPTRNFIPPAKVDVVPMRKKLGMTQAAFAQAFGLNVATIRDWEQGRRQPEGAARILLAIISKHPQVVREVLLETQGT